MTLTKRVRTPLLDIAYDEASPAGEHAVVPLHGFPCDPRDFDEGMPILKAAGFRTIATYLRFSGSTR
jgi:pimeloyl-ACP methyl ester carboxylesterase